MAQSDDAAQKRPSDSEARDSLPAGENVDSHSPPLGPRDELTKGSSDVQRFLSLVVCSHIHNDMENKNLLLNDWSEYWPRFKFEDVNSLFVHRDLDLFEKAQVRGPEAYCFQWEIPAVLKELKSCLPRDSPDLYEKTNLDDHLDLSPFERFSIRRYFRVSGGIPLDSAVRELWKLAVISGADEKFEYKPCLRFAYDRWGSRGLDILSRLWVELSDHRRESQDPNGSPDKGAGIRRVQFLSINESFLLVNIVGKDEPFFKQCLEILTWVCLAVRINHEWTQDSGQLRISEMVEQDVWSYRKLSVHFCGLKPLRRVVGHELDPSCWTECFATGIVACFPSARHYGRGLKISFQDMVQLTDVQNYRFVCGGIILHGFFTALIPISWNEDDGSVQWHFVHVPTTDFSTLGSW
ncbi:hypothetical protein F5Y17DRAFT_166666 [Xylariaceae sp. FL0594]|nr:hypothetical protein F5Y17DRAFT_166666 [Xylariaceae sp. FL0594]